MGQEKPKNLSGHGRFLPKRGPGRPVGSKNKVSQTVKEMILQAAHDLGGVKYLVEQGKKNPAAFLTLLGKALPLELHGEGGGPIVVEMVRFADKDS